MYTAEEFWAQTVPEPNTGCILWLGCVNNIGYGITSFMGEKILAHRLAHRIATGKIEIKNNVLHSCTTRSCVNPEHLREGTQTENVADMFAAQRAPNYNKQLTHCRRGHLLEGSNVRLKINRGKTRRQCIACLKLR